MKERSKVVPWDSHRAPGTAGGCGLRTGDGWAWQGRAGLAGVEDLRGVVRGSQKGGGAKSADGISIIVIRSLLVL